MKSISTKVILVFVLMIIPLNFIAIFQSEKVMESAVEEIRMTEQNLLDVYANTLEAKMDNSVSLLEYFRLKDVDFLQMSTQDDKEIYKYQGAKSRLYAKMTFMAEMIDGSRNYFYYLPKVDDIVVMSNPYIGSENVKRLQNFMSSENLKADKLGWNYIENEDEKILFMILRMKNVVYGTWLDLEDISSGILDSIKYSNVELSFSQDEKENNVGEDKLIIQGKAKDLYITLSLEKEEIIRTDALYQRTLLHFALFYLILVPCLFVIMKRIMIKPLQKVNAAHQQLEGGNLEYRLTEQANSKEFLDAYKSFNKMASMIKMLRIQAYENKIEKQQIELRNLQLQIRPHFLLNTFNLIYSLAEKKESDSIQDITIYLSEYFRYIFRSGRDLELFTKEMHLIEGYVQMAAIRYENLVELSVDLDPELDFVRTPPLLIHNFVENAVKYGFKQGRKLQISLEGRYDSGRVTFQIMDDGNGMDEVTLERNQKMFRGEYIPKDKTSHLGLYNSYKRLKYFYGEEASIDVQSEKEEMSCFTISFPYNLEVDDESFNVE